MAGFIHDAVVLHAAADGAVARRLRTSLERFPIARYTQGRVRRFHVAAASDSPALDRLDEAAHLIIICSRSAARSRAVIEVLEYCLARGRRERILAIFIDGRPFVGGDEECVPAPLHYRAKGLGENPLVVDARSSRRHGATTALAAVLADLDIETLTRRHARRALKRRALLVSAAATLLAATLAGALTAVELLRRDQAMERAERTTGYERLRAAVDALPPRGAILPDLGNRARVEALLDNPGDRLLLASAAPRAPAPEYVATSRIQQSSAGHSAVRVYEEAPTRRVYLSAEGSFVARQFGVDVEVRERISGALIGRLRTAHNGQIFVARGARRIISAPSPPQGDFRSDTFCGDVEIFERNGESWTSERGPPMPCRNMGAVGQMFAVSGDGEIILTEWVRGRAGLEYETCFDVFRTSLRRSQRLVCGTWLFRAQDSGARRLALLTHTGELSVFDLTSGRRQSDWPSAPGCNFTYACTLGSLDDEGNRLLLTMNDGRQNRLVLLSPSALEILAVLPGDVEPIGVINEANIERAWWLASDRELWSCEVTACDTTKRLVFTLDDARVDGRVVGEEGLVRLRPGGQGWMLVDLRVLVTPIEDALSFFCRSTIADMQTEVSASGELAASPCARRGLGFAWSN